MSDKAQAMIDELVAACIEFGRQADPDRLTRLKKARQELHEYIAELEAAQRWHVVADGDLPNTYKPVLTVDMSEATRIPVPAFYNLDTNCWLS